MNAKKTSLRLDEALAQRGLVQSRSQAADYIRRGRVKVDGVVSSKPGKLVRPEATVVVTGQDRYVSRAGEKLASIAAALNLDFKGRVVLDVGSSTGGFTDFALQHGATKVIAVEAGKDQLHPKLHGNQRIELHEQTDIRELTELSVPADIVVIDVSFVSLREILPHVRTLANPLTQIVAMVKPQFEAPDELKHKGVIKNERTRRDILQAFEQWAKQSFVILNKADSQVAGAKGNLERFYLLGLL